MAERQADTWDRQAAGTESDQGHPSDAAVRWCRADDASPRQGMMTGGSVGTNGAGRRCIGALAAVQQALWMGDSTHGEHATGSCTAAWEDGLSPFWRRLMRILAPGAGL